MLSVMLPNRRKRIWYGLVLFAAPFPIAALVSYLGKPIWQAERLFAFITPFFAAGMAIAWFGEYRQNILKTGIRVLLAGSAALMIWGTIDYTLYYQKPSTFLEATETIRSRATPDDIVVVASPRVAWGVKWYLLGHDWDQTIWEEVFAMPDEVCGDRDFTLCIRRKIKIFDRRARGTSPRIVVAEHQDLELGSEKRIWTVTRKRHNYDDLRRKYNLDQLEKQAFNFKAMQVVLFSRDVGQ
jgi:hypothetical protein